MTDVSGLAISYFPVCGCKFDGSTEWLGFHFHGRSRTPVENLVDAGEGPVSAFYLDNQVEGKVAVGGVNSAHCTGDFVDTNMEGTSQWKLTWTA